MNIILQQLFSLSLPLQTNILKYIPDTRTIFLIEIRKYREKIIYNLNCKIKSLEKKRKLLEINKTIVETNIYRSCQHINYITERHCDYHHTITEKRCKLCNLKLKYGDGMNEIEYKYIN
jgi:hypothetical protein